MKIKRIGQNEIELYHNGIIVLFSYETPVAALVLDGTAYCTTNKYSSATSSHITKAVRRWGARRQDVDQLTIEGLL